MKAYKKYMDSISVSDTLHRKLVSCAAGVRPARRPTMFVRYAAAFACFAVILLSLLTVPRLLQSNVGPGGSPSVTQPGESATTPGTPATVTDAADEYELFFNKADRSLSGDVGIPGHFWQELTPGELRAVFPGLAETYAVTATANFQSDGTGAALFNIDARAVPASGCTAYIQVAPGEVAVDYVLDGDVKTSDVLGTAVTAGYFETKPNSKGQRNVIYFAFFKLSGLGYYVELGGAEAKEAALKDEFTSLIGLLIKGGAADLDVLDPVIPELREEALNLNEARADADFGAYLPANLPSGFTFESAWRFTNQEQDSLSALWIKGMGDIHWRVSVLGEEDKARITSVADAQNYDLSLYPIPHADSVPDELREIVDDPIFRSKELTLEAVQARAYKVSDAGDEPGCRMRFGVLYGDILVEVNVKGAAPESVFEMLQQIDRNRS